MTGHLSSGKPYAITYGVIAYGVIALSEAALFFPLIEISGANVQPDALAFQHALQSGYAERVTPAQAQLETFVPSVFFVAHDAGDPLSRLFGQVPHRLERA